jgi:Putative transposase/Transposase zinc-binding domain
MKCRHPLKKILSQARPYWDQDEMPASARKVFGKALQCRTPELGAEVYSSENRELILYHTCKSRACPSCGYRATVQWLRERWAALPNESYRGITFTMPDLLWSLFRDHPRLAKALPALAAGILQARVSARYGVRVGMIAILHTFNGKLEFNSHVHTMVTGGGAYGANTWISRVHYDRALLMQAWRRAVIALLRAALQAGKLRTAMDIDQMEEMLTQQENRWWSIKIQSFTSKEHFLRYAGRYVRRPPIAQRRITHIGKRNVRFWFNDKKLRGRVYVQCSLEEFIDRWAQHIPERYEHGVRNFGLFAPRSLQQTSAAIFAILEQEQKRRPRPRPWADSLKRDFGHDPLLDQTGKRMKWVRRLAPETSRYPEL